MVNAEHIQFAIRSGLLPVHERITTVLLLVLFLGFYGSVVVILLSRYSNLSLDGATLFSAIFPAGISIIVIVSLPLFFLAALTQLDLDFQLLFSILSLVLAICILLMGVKVSRIRRGVTKTTMTVAALFFVFVVLRMYIVKDLALPLYSDSVEHFLIVDDFLNPTLPARALYKLTRITSRYYHFGFHSAAAWFSVMTNAGVGETILVFGQIIQALIPLSLYFPIQLITKDRFAGLVTVLFAGVCWTMPGFATNWGKYPALISLAIYPYTAGMLYLSFLLRNKYKNRPVYFLTMVACLVLGLSHTRSIVLLMFAITSWWIIGWLDQKYRINNIVATLLIAAIYFVGNIILKDNQLSGVFNPYLRDGEYPVTFVLLLLPFGLYKYPRFTGSILLFLLLILSGALAPLPGLVNNFGYKALFDRPFLQVSLYLPLSALGGLGYAGLVRSITRSEKVAGLIRHAIHIGTAIVPLLLVIQPMIHYELQPSSCCQLFHDDDLNAFQWMQNRLSKESTILIAGNRTPVRVYGVDGGIWISPLLDYKTILFPNRTNFKSNTIHEQLCAEGVTHIYAGGTSFRFSVEEMEAAYPSYRRVYTSPGAYLYEVLSCK